MTSTLTGQNTIPLRLVANEDTSDRSEYPLLSLTREMRDGNDRAWNEFHQRYYIGLLRFAASRISQSDDAAEIVQQAYLRIARHIKPFSHEADLWRWLLCIVRCVAMDHQRGIKRRSTFLEKLAHWHGVQGNHSELPDATTNSLARDALAKLSEDEAQLIRLKYYEGWSIEQLAADTNTTPKAVESRLARLRHRLREIISRIQ